MSRWTVHLEGGPRRVNHAAVAIGERIYSFGGHCTGEDYETISFIDVHVLDTNSLRWKLLHVPARRNLSPPPSEDPTIPYQRYGHSAVAYKDCAYIWGGRNNRNGACNVLFMFNTVLRQWGNVETNGPIPGARDGHSACVIHKKMYIFGGFEEETDRFSDEIYSYDFETKTWAFIRTQGTPARWRDFHTAVGIDRFMYVFGGRSDHGGSMYTNRELYCDKIHGFDTVTNTWFQPVAHGLIPTGRRSHSMFTHQKCIYIFGGYNGHHDLHFKDIFMFDTKTNYWSLVEVGGKGPCARRRPSCCKIGTKVFLFGGTSPSNPPPHDADEVGVPLMDLSDLHVLDLAPSLKTLAKLAVLEHKLDTSCLPRDTRWELAAMTTPNVISRSINSNG